MTGRGLRGRDTARWMLLVALVVDAFGVCLWIAAPNFIEAARIGPPSTLESLVPVVGVAMNVVGLGWMVRIYRADPEAHSSFWRYHRR
jgi:hypothetical protein